MNVQAPPLDPDPLSPYVAWAGQRNRNSILRVLKQELGPEDGQILEFGSGSGMHITHFAARLPSARWRPSDRTNRTFANIRALSASAACINVEDPIVLDLTDEATWPSDPTMRLSVIFCINIFQVAPVCIAEAMMKCAASLLSPGGRLMIYGPFKLNGAYRSETDAAFDAKLRSSGVAEWGLKDVLELDAAALAARLVPGKRIGMPANNLFLNYAAS